MATVRQSSTGGTPGTDFIELGLLFFVTGLTFVVAGALIELLILKGGLLPGWEAFLLGACLLSGLAVLAVRLSLRLAWFLKRLK